MIHDLPECIYNPFIHKLNNIDPLDLLNDKPLSMVGNETLTNNVSRFIINPFINEDTTSQPGQSVTTQNKLNISLGQNNFTYTGEGILLSVHATHLTSATNNIQIVIDGQTIINENVISGRKNTLFFGSGVTQDAGGGLVNYLVSVGDLNRVINFKGKLQGIISGSTSSNTLFVHYIKIGS